MLPGHDTDLVNRLYLVGADGSARELDLRGYDGGRLVWSPDGTWIAYPDDDGRIQVGTI